MLQPWQPGHPVQPGYLILGEHELPQGGHLLKGALSELAQVVLGQIEVLEGRQVRETSEGLELFL